MSNDKSKPSQHTRSQDIFLTASPVIQKLVRDVLTQEREVAHLPSRIGSGILEKISNLIRQIK